MPKISEGQFALGGLAFFSFWLLVVLPLLNNPSVDTPKRDHYASVAQHEPEIVTPLSIWYQVFTSSGRQRISEYCDSVDGEKKDWAHKYICDVRVSDFYVAIFTCALTIVTVGLIVVGFFTIRRMRITEARQLRAYVCLTEGQIRIIQNGGAAEVTFALKNSGQTPGYDFRTSTKIEVKGASEREPYTNLISPESKSIIGPSSAVTIGPNVVIFEPGELDGIKDGTKRIYVWGRADYIDAFKEPRFFIFQAFNGQMVTQIDLSNNRVISQGWPIKPSKDGYRAN